MADYYPLIARAIAGLDPNAPGESRRALYERARAALIQQLRSVQPPLSEIGDHPGAIVVGRGRAQGRVGGRPARPRRLPCRRRRPRRRRLPPRQCQCRPPGCAGPRRPAAPPHPDTAAVAGQRPSAAQPSSRCAGPAAWPAGAARLDPRSATAADPRAPARRAPRARAPPPVSPAAPGIRGFRDIEADANDLGRAAAQANRSARKTYANVPSPSPEFDRLEPNLENRGADPDQPYSYDESIEEAERYAPSGAPPMPPPQRSRVGGGDREVRSGPGWAQCSRSRLRSRSASS